MITDELCEKIIKTQNPSVVGLDTSYSYVPEEMRRGEYFCVAGEAILEFNKRIIDAVCDVVPAVKVQVAYYEMYSVEGMKAFLETLKYAKEKGLIVIADCKRNDIGATCSCYAEAYLGKKPAFPSDMLTVNGYLGSDGIKPFTKLCDENDKAVFVLVKTSNPSGGELQDRRFMSGESVYEYMGQYVESLNGIVGEYGYGRVGAVVGATYPEQGKVLREKMKKSLFLVPGYGAQGGTAEELSVCFDDSGLGAVVNSSRGIICAYRKPKYEGLSFADAARAACIDMRDDILSALKGRGIKRIGK